MKTYKLKFKSQSENNLNIIFPPKAVVSRLHGVTNQKTIKRTHDSSVSIVTKLYATREWRYGSKPGRVKSI